MTRGSPKFWVSFGACLVLPLALILLTWAEPNAWFSSDIAVKMLQVEGCAEGDCIIPYHAVAEDPEQRFRPIQYPFAEPHEGGKGYVSIYGNLLIRSAALIRSVFGAWGVLALPFCSFLFLLAGAVGVGRSLGLSSSRSVLGAGLMTSTWFYAAVFWEHLPAAAAVLWTVFFMLRLTEAEPSAAPDRRALAATVLVGALSMAFRPESALAIFSFGVFAWLEAPRHARPPLAIAGALMLSVMGLIYLLSPEILPTAQLAHNITDHGFDLSVWLRQRMDHAVNALAGVYEQGQTHQGKASYIVSGVAAGAWLAVVLFSVVPGFSSTLALWIRFSLALVAAGLPVAFMDATGLAQPLGLLVVSPLLFFLPARVEGLQKRVLHRGSLVFVGLCLFTMPNEGGLQIGARYLLPVAPILVLFALAFLSSLSAQGVGGAGALVKSVIALTFLAQGFAFSHVLSVDREKDETVAAIRAMPADAYATTDGFLACELTSLVWPRPVYFVPNPAQPDELVGVMRKRGVRSLVMVGDLPRNPPAGVVMFGGYRLNSILPTPWYPLPNKAAWAFAIPDS